ncbi:FG-GAP-like repeat-containing protein [Anaeromyxobacter oryzisoli]|uniref:FG-GAP-like repeat-containing protein n=1 Tax=Anaeromyxobacter oryzisoli TaxID=2925408 RepID=UPI001F56F6AB|nr:FG-GAP-like repeat-containing protein [Anaeromyxobacter sp. SG63]
MKELLLAVALGAGALSNFPRESGGRISHPAIGVVVGGAPAVIVPAGELLTAFHAGGKTPAGFPFLLGMDEVASGAAAAADMDGDGRAEIAVATASGKIFLWSGAVVPGYPVATVGAGVKAGVSFGDVDGDGRPELLVGDDQGRIHAFKKGGAEARGYPVQVGRAITSPVSASSFGGGRAIAAGCGDGRVVVLDAATGRPRPGFPLATHFTVSGAPIFVDLDDDGEMDLVVASQDFSVYAVNAKGEPLPGFPVSAGYRLYEAPAIADLDGDGRLDVVFASADGFVHAVDRTGKALKGFPARVGARLFGGAVIGDVDRDGALDVVVATADGAVHALSRTGKPLAGFPAAAAGEATATPLLYDLAGDGSLSAFVGVSSGALHAVRAPRLGPGVAAAPWPGPGRDAARSGRYGPNPPTYKDLKLEPARPRVGDALGARWRGVWLDAGPGEKLATPRIEWFRDGQPVKELEGRRDLPAGTARRGQRWRFVLSQPKGDSRAEGPEVTIADTAPGAAQVALEPAHPTRGAAVKAVIARPAADADGDALTYRIEWLQDGAETGITGETFPGDRMKKGALLAARVVASDGELQGPAGIAQARVADTAPGGVKVALEPQQPSRTEPVRARVAAPALDVDGDPIAYHYRWKVNGEVRNVPLASAELPAGLFRKHQKVTVEARAFDGDLEGPPASAEVEARNSPPTAPRVVILPERPRKGDALRAAFAASAVDADADPLSYRFTWRKNGQPLPVAGDGREVPGTEVARGDRFEVAVVPNDGEVDGPAGVASVAVVNTPPTSPRVAIEPAHPKGGETLKLVVVEPARDVDGDAVRLGIAWTREGRPTGTGAETLAPTEFKKHDRVRVVVTPRDGEEAGEPAAYEVVVDDAAPTAPVVAFPSERHTVTAPLRVALEKKAQDADGDELRYRYRWLRDGAPIAQPDGTETSRSAPFWTAAAEVPTTQLAKGQRWEVEVQAFDGEQYGPSARAATTIVNSPPPVPKIAFAPARPRRVDGLALAITQAPDADDDVIRYRYAWTRNGERWETPPDQAQIPRGVAKKGERWGVEVVASDGEADAPATRLEVTISDTAPGPTAVSLCDGPVPAGTVLQARVAATSADADGDPVSYRHDWSVNGWPVAAMQGQARLTTPAIRKHDLVRAVVTPTDGELSGPPAVAECRVVNTPPTAPSVVLEPAEPTAGSGVRAVIRKPSSDLDGDAIVYRYAWTRNGLPTPHAGAAIPAAVLRHGEVWRVTVTPFDGEAEGAPVEVTATVKNTPPPAPSVLLRPAAAVVGQVLTCDAQVPQRDADQEPITVRYRWYRNDRLEAIAEDRPVLPAGVIHRDERWKCEAWSSDGHAESARVSAQLTVKDSPPAAPQVVVEPARARKADDLVCRIAAPSADPDGDSVTYAYAWWRDERPMPAGADPARIESSRIAKGQRWRCAATPTDGTLAGPAGTGERVVANTPPGPARVRLEPESPHGNQTLRCAVVDPSEDADRDAVRYRIAWFRNGSAQPFAETSQEVPARLVRAGDRWRCEVVPTDGTDDGPLAGSEEVLVGPGPEDALSAAGGP